MVEDGVEVKARKAGVEVSDEPLLVAVDNLKKGMVFTMSQLNSKRVPPEKKLRWLKALTRQAEALVNVIEALHNIGSKSASDADLAIFLSSVQESVDGPVRESRRMRNAALEFHDVVRQASLSEGGVGSAGKRRTCRDWR
jgi:hypothetical protein